MSTTSAAFGFRLARQPSVHGTARKFPIASGLAVNLFNGDPVKLADTIGGGTIDLATNDGTRSGTIAGAVVLGIFVGCEYKDSTGKFVQSAYWPTGTSATEAYAWVVEGDQNEFIVQADGVVAEADIGSQANFSLGASPYGSTSTGISNATLSATQIADEAQGQFQIVEFVRDGNNVPGDAFTQVIVRIANPQLGRAGRTAQNAAGT